MSRRRNSKYPKVDDIGGTLEAEIGIGNIRIMFIYRLFTNMTTYHLFQISFPRRD